MQNISKQKFSKISGRDQMQTHDEHQVPGKSTPKHVVLKLQKATVSQSAAQC